jgi:hypothetical protein
MNEEYTGLGKFGNRTRTKAENLVENFFHTDYRLRRHNFPRILPNFQRENFTVDAKMDDVGIRSECRELGLQRCSTNISNEARETLIKAPEKINEVFERNKNLIKLKTNVRFSNWKRKVSLIDDNNEDATIKLLEKQSPSHSGWWNQSNFYRSKPHDKLIHKT